MSLALQLSIITVSFNSAATIAQTINSVLSQTHPRIQYIIIDGGSTDGTVNIVKSYGDRIDAFVSEPDNGIYDAMNKGIALATGEVIGILNSDDVFANEHVISAVAEAFASEVSIDAVYGDITMYTDDPAKPARRWKAGQQKSFLTGWHPPHPGLFLRRSCYQAFGLYKPDFKVSADFELMLRFFEVEKIAARYIPETLVNMRLGGESTGGLRKILTGNLNIRRAFKVNRVPYPWSYPIVRLSKKLLQYV